MHRSFDTERRRQVAQDHEGVSNVSAPGPDLLKQLQRAIGNHGLQRLVRAQGVARNLSERVTQSTLDSLLAGSASHPIGPFERQAAEQWRAELPDHIQVHEDENARLASALLGAHAFTLGKHIYLGATVGTPLGPARETALRHELVHVGQVRLGQKGTLGSHEEIEREAYAIAGASAGSIHKGAAGDQPHGLWWVIPIVAGLYVLLRPNVANAPESANTPTYPSVSNTQVAAEALALFAVPSGVAGALGRAGYGIVASFAISGAAGSVAYRGVQDVGAGRFSGVSAYIVDATTGAVIGAVMGGVVNLFPGVRASWTAMARPGQTPPLVHLTDEPGFAGITQGTPSAIRGSQGIYAVPDTVTTESTAMRVLRTLLRPSRTAFPVPVPEGAAGAFSRPIPLGPVSLYQRLMGVFRAPAGQILLPSGEFVASGQWWANISGQIFPYGVDAAIWVGAGTGVSLLAPGDEHANERGLYSPLYSYLQPNTQSPLSSLSNGPFILMQPAGEMANDPAAIMSLMPPDATQNQMFTPTFSGEETPAVILVYPIDDWNAQGGR